MTKLHVKLSADKKLALCGVWTKDFVLVEQVDNTHEKPLCKNCLKNAKFSHGMEPNAPSGKPE